MPYLLASMKCTRCIFMECRRNRSPRASASFCYRLHAARSSARQNFRSHGHGSALCQTADCFPPREHLRIDLGSRVPQKAPFLHIFWSSSDAPGDPPQPPQHGAGFWEQSADKRLPLPTGGGTNSAAILLSQYTVRSGSHPRSCPSGWWLGFCSHCLSTCPRARRSTSARATDCAGKRAFGNRVAAWPKLAPDRCFGYI